MSKSEVERFAKDLATKPALLTEVLAIATRHGYAITVEDAKTAGESLSDAALERVAAGESAQEGLEEAAKLAEKELGMRGGKQ